MTNQEFGFLQVIKKLNSQDSNGNIYWLCKCQCGNYCEVRSDRLKLGITKSCGCIKSSINEKLIEQYLKELQLEFVTQYNFEDCKSNKNYPLRFDFFVNNSYIIEYDGEQHFLSKEQGIFTQDKLNIIHQNDLIKNEYCFKNNIPIIRIPYNKNYSKKDLILETTDFLFTKDNEIEYYKN